MAGILSGNVLVFPSSLVDASEVGLLPVAVAVPLVVLLLGEAVGAEVAASKVESGWAATPIMVGATLLVGETVGLTEGKLDGASLNVTDGDALG